jgi:hypothetical protein
LDDEPSCAVALAANGPGAAALQQHTVMRGGGWSAARLAEDGAAGRLYVPDARVEDKV